MKRNIIICSVLAIALMLVPLLVMKGKADDKPEDTVKQVSDDGYISVMKTENGKVLELDNKEYLIGVLAAEADMSHHEEALKAQVVASYTYALYIKSNSQTEELNGADISDDAETHQGYLSLEERKDKWGDKFEEYEKKAGKIFDSVKNRKICYNGFPILAVYHNLNSGKTQSALTVWKEEIPYLCAKESAGDKLSGEYINTVSLEYSEFKRLIEKVDGVILSDDESEWIGQLQREDDGYVKYIEICGNDVSSQDFRTALNLKSCVFEIENSGDGVLEISTYGNGHMVGMSQYGADYMARQGSDYQEILQYYYTDVEIQ
jgi:stage II sporulation protein D